ncbi:phosphoribosyl-AMP cyclohydrolase [Chitinivibrio alkaliphilus]|uniref:Phosphoribosyl-AMP cyclohydrolase n=1 Tax=Chitinivibrio alkaliphilus ACht1 TaxID=1313304 RepID=U7DCD7_9BACT|nr:phosphoribosyl-AMP cyclohydrolase [Chitinivibrio alkaliphilus]ERP39238.1 Phosphoribosyl-AMP cyclohydrolase [Chitinivibrio alkaliphilus ACht1]
MKNSDALLREVRFNDQGLVCAIAQDAESGRVLMQAWMNRDTLKETLETGDMVYWSRSRQERWKKGETSGHTQKVQEARIDCDGDSLLFRIFQKGAACHKGYRSCFYRRAEDTTWGETESPCADMS